MLKVSIIISTYNYPAALDCVLTQLQKETTLLQNPCEILIADDGSSDETRTVINTHKKALPTLKHLWHEDQGFRKTLILNKTVAEATGDYLIFLDGDCIPCPDFLKQHSALAEKGYFVAGNRVLLSKNFTRIFLKDPHHSLFQRSNLQWLLLFLKNNTNKMIPAIRNTFLMTLLKKIRFPYWRTTNWKFPKGCNFSVFKNDFIAVNGYDETFQGWGHEDSDLFIRLLHNGVQIKNGKFLATVFHLWHKSASKDHTADNYQRLTALEKDKNVIRAVKGFDQ
ncbi:MAG: glycosyltransferase family 2 protein [Coxiellaceae bacterium]|nr:glycosyltransferase family 2 protein [Coxiellaceae bacterium]